MSDNITYLEDVEPPRKTENQQGDNAGAAVTTSHTAKDVSSSKVQVATKRQLSIADMFSSQSSSKRQKLESATSTATVKKSVSGLASLNSIPLNLDAFFDSLTDEAKTLLKLELEAMGKSWLKVLLDEIQKPYFLSLKRWLVSEGLSAEVPTLSHRNFKIFPPATEIYTWSQTPLGQVRVVILGQDPYHSPGQAHGLSFSVPKGVTPPPSLKNIYAEIKAEYPDFVIPKHGNLSTWAANGVVLLNTCLTVRAYEAGSHSNKGWEQFTDRVVDVIDRYGGANIHSGDLPGQKNGIGRGVVFLAWGSWAQKRVAKLNKKKHLILTSAVSSLSAVLADLTGARIFQHPSPLSAYKGFFGNNHFKAANAWLEKKYGTDNMVDWCKLD